MHMQSRSELVEGVRMRWEEAGTGTPVVFVHGIPTSPALWRRVAALVPDARCLAFEMVGYGESIPEGRERDISIRQQADYLVAWLRHLNIDRAVLAGHDLGGGVVQIVAVRHPELCAGLFLTNAIGYDSWPIPSVKALRAMAPMASHLPPIAGKQILRTLMYRGHDDMALAKEALETHWQHYAENDGVEGLLRQMKALDVNDTLAVADEIPLISVPARVVWGDADQFQKLQYGKRFARELNAPLRTIPGGKHFTPEDHPEILAEELRSLLVTLH